MIRRKIEERAARAPARTRLRFEMRLTPHEDAALREAAARLGTTMTDYVLSRTVYGSRRASEGPGGLEPALGALRSQALALSRIALAAERLAADRRSSAAQALSRELRELVRGSRPQVLRATAAACEALGARRPRRR